LPQLRASDDEVAAERVQLAGAGIDASRPFRVVVATDPADPRALRPERLRQLARAPQALLLTGPAERDLALGDGDERPRVHHGAGEVRRLIALGTLVARAGGEVIGPDQGASHVLLAAGARGRILFGSQDPRRTAPPTAQALVAPAALSCRPCRADACRLAAAERFACMDFDPDDGVPVELGLPRPGAVADA
ncbi:MAG: hypothetical protein KAI24_04825, partial [Planctomycetes bacterium]|nr:hypothetical protein [Planctomycetota bacterium]